MTTRPHPKKGLYLDGLHFEPGRIFSSSSRAERFYGLLLGPNYFMTGQTYKQRQAKAVVVLTAIFSICVSRLDTFVALNNPELGWQIVTGDIREEYNAIMTPDEVQELVSVFAAARSRFLEHVNSGVTVKPASSKLQSLIDQWLDATGRDDRAPADDVLPCEPNPLVARPAPLENLIAGFGLLDHNPTPAASHAHTWPPSHLAATDIDFLSHPRVREHLAGVSWHTKGAMPSLPGEKSDPLALRLFVGWLAAAHTPPPPQQSPIALYAAPIAFKSSKDRQTWYRPSGDQSKMFGHLAGFLAYATEAFRGGKSMVLGLLTPVQTTPQMADQTAKDFYGGDAVEAFSRDPKLRRFGAAMMLRHVERKGVRGVQVAFFCPWDRHGWIKRAWQLQKWHVLDWKGYVADAVDAWAEQNGVVVHEGYTGGSIVVRKDRDQDSVEMAAGWVLRVVTATNKTIPSAEEEDGWEWEEVCFFRKWDHLVREEDEDAEMEVDMKV